jgi:hypothetical protein
MPFTFSHPAIVLPLLKLAPKYVSASAIIMGSMAPDFEYFIRMRLQQQHGHSIAGVFYFDLPVALICLVVFHLFVRDTLIYHLPAFLQKKYQHYIGQDWISYARKNWLVVISSAVIGIFSHLFWDAFTHAPGYFVQFIPFLQQTISVFNVDVPSYDLMQLISTFIGGIVLMIYVLWPTNEFFKGHNWYKSLRYAGVVSFIAGIVFIFRRADTQSEVIATVISGVLIGMIIAPVFLRGLVKLKIISAKRD